MVALVSKQVTAYNAVNNSTVSRTSASKYGEFTQPSWGGEGALSSCSWDGNAPGRRWTPKGRELGGQAGRLTVGEESWAAGRPLVLGGNSDEGAEVTPPPPEQAETLTCASILHTRRCFHLLILIIVRQVPNNPVH